MRPFDDTAPGSISNGAGNVKWSALTLVDLVHMQQEFEDAVGPAQPDAVKCSLASFKHLSLVLGMHHQKETMIPIQTQFIGLRVFEDNSMPFGAYEMGYIVGGKFKQHS